MAVDNAQLKAMGELLVERGLTWKGATVIGIHPPEKEDDSWYLKCTYGGGDSLHEVYVSLEQWLFDSEFELAKCLWGEELTMQDHCYRCECMGDKGIPMYKYKLANIVRYEANYLQYLLDSLDLHGEEGSRN